MGLVKTRRLAYPPLVGVRDPWGSGHAERSECRAMHKQQRAKAAMKLPMKGDIRRITNRSTIAAMREAERISDNPFVPKYSTRESLVRSLDA